MIIKLLVMCNLEKYSCLYWVKFSINLHISSVNKFWIYCITENNLFYVICIFMLQKVEFGEVFILFLYLENWPFFLHRMLTISYFCANNFKLKIGKEVIFSSIDEFITPFWKTRYWWSPRRNCICNLFHFRR